MKTVHNYLCFVSPETVATSDPTLTLGDNKEARLVESAMIDIKSVGTKN